MKNALSRTLPRLIFSDRAPAAGPEVIEPFLGHVQLMGMFNRIGSSYDLQNHLLSFGLDRLWRRLFVDALRPPAGATICDMAVGTGDIAIPMARRYRDVKIVGVDYSAGMLAVARRKIAAAGLADRISLVESDMRATPIPSSSAEVITSAFTLRNLPDRDRALGEFKRILKPGGRLFVLELGMPERFPVKLIYRPYFDHFMPFLGNLLSRTDYAYSYLRESVYAFPKPHLFLDELRECGFRRTRAVKISYGTAVLYTARRDPEE
ncbi:MAG TPA: ubiquinone/menaquinone biosynthesis methyltransferase [Spirochaetia bacterium]|nr:ubiquinone/menaquinone biosynthesis methyltransferase [Spirochaetia bacterium]